MRNLLVADIPVIVLQNWSLNDTEGHYRIVVGYDLIADKMVMYDPWDRDGQVRASVVCSSCPISQFCLFYVAFFHFILAPSLRGVHKRLCDALEQDGDDRHQRIAFNDPFSWSRYDAVVCQCDRHPMFVSQTFPRRSAAN
jgi:hypothetical protein